MTGTGKPVANLTPAQAYAALRALDSYLSVGTREECVRIFGSGQGVEAAARARDELRRVALPYLRIAQREAASP